MFTFQALAQQGINFGGQLYKDDKIIGGIGNSQDGVYVRLRNHLNVSEMQELMKFIGGMPPQFKDSAFDLSYVDE